MKHLDDAQIACLVEQKKKGTTTRQILYNFAEIYGRHIDPSTLYYHWGKAVKDQKLQKRYVPEKIDRELQTVSGEGSYRVYPLQVRGVPLEGIVCEGSVPWGTYQVVVKDGTISLG